MTEWELLRIVARALWDRLARLHDEEAGLTSLELTALALVLVGVAGALALILRSKVTQGANGIELPGSQP